MYTSYQIWLTLNSKSVFLFQTFVNLTVIHTHTSVAHEIETIYVGCVDFYLYQLKLPKLVIDNFCSYLSSSYKATRKIPMMMWPDYIIACSWIKIGIERTKSVTLPPLSKINITLCYVSHLCANVTMCNITTCKLRVVYELFRYNVDIASVRMS